MYQVTDSDGILYPITMGRMPLRDFNPGWHPVGLQTSLRPFHLLELRSDGHPDAVWYLNEELDFVANTPLQFTPEQAGLLVSSLSPLLRDIYDQALCAPEPAVAESSHAFDGINPRFVQELIGFVVEAALSPPDVVAAQRLDGVSAHYTANGVRLSASLLRHSLDVTASEPMQPDLAHPDLAHPKLAHPKLVSGAFSVASPFDATLLFAQEHFVPADGAFIQVCRFRDPVGQLTFYLLFQQGGAPALYIPAMNTVFAMQDGLSGALVMTTLLSHYASDTGRVTQPSPPEPPHAEAAAETPQEAPQEAQGSPGEPAAALHVEAHAEAVRTNSARDGLVEDQPVRDQPKPARSADAPHGNWWKRLFGLGNP